MNLCLVPILAVLAVFPAAAAEQAGTVPVRDLSHIHGVVLPAGSDVVLLATHQGLYSVEQSGRARMISPTADDFMGFTASPEGRLYASGHPAAGGNTGVIGAAGPDSEWTTLSQGAGGPVDFHALTVSPADPQTLYGSYGGVQVSRDAGRSWSIAGPDPAELIDLAAAVDGPGHLYAGTMTGLFESTDFGSSWSAVAAQGVPVAAVEVAPNGKLYAFVPSSGLLVLRDAELVSVAEMTDRVFLHMAFDRDDPARMVAITAESQVLSSADGGKSWSSFAP